MEGNSADWAKIVNMNFNEQPGDFNKTFHLYNLGNI